MPLGCLFTVLMPLHMNIDILTLHHFTLSGTPEVETSPAGNLVCSPVFMATAIVT